MANTKNTTKNKARDDKWKSTGGACVPVDIKKIKWANKPTKK